MLTVVFLRSSPLTFQSLSEEDRRLWLDAMDGREPVYNEPSRPNEPNSEFLSYSQVVFVNSQ